jgi:Tfp pilus assembly protein PilW
VRFHRTLFLLAACAAIGGLAPSSASAEVIYSVSVDTSSQLHQTGFIDIEFNPGDNTSQLATLAITGFTGGTLQPALTPPTGAPVGDVSGLLPGTVLFDNVQTTNEYTEGITFGNSLHFLATFDGPAIQTPNGSTGSLFQLDFLNANGSAFLFTADPEGNNAFDFNVATIALNSDGTLTPATYLDTNGSSDATVTLAPEPATFLLLGAALALLSRYRK